MKYLVSSTVVKIESSIAPDRMPRYSASDLEPMSMDPDHPPSNSASNRVPNCLLFGIIVCLFGSFVSVRAKQKFELSRFDFTCLLVRRKNLDITNQSSFIC